MSLQKVVTVKIWLEQYLWGWCVYEAAVSGSWFICPSGLRIESMKGTQLNDRKFIFEIFKYGSEQMEGDGWSSARQFGTCICADGLTEQWNEEDQKVKSRDLWSVAVLQDTSLGWLGLLTLTVVSTCMGDCQEYQPVRKHHMLHTSVHMWHSLIIELVGETKHWSLLEDRLHPAIAASKCSVSKRPPGPS